MRPILLIFLLGFAAALFLAGCGVDGEPTAPNGRDVFPADTQPGINR